MEAARPAQAHSNGATKNGAEIAPLEANPLAAELDRTRAELESARAQLEASQQRLLASDRTHTGEMRELRRKLAASSAQATTLGDALEAEQRTRSELAACQRSEIHLQRYCDRLEARLERATQESARIQQLLRTRP